jgi:hypothetical protein
MYRADISCGVMTTCTIVEDFDILKDCLSSFNARLEFSTVSRLVLERVVVGLGTSNRDLLKFYQ